jgi:hypothetical protein
MSKYGADKNQNETHQSPPNTKFLINPFRSSWEGTFGEINGRHSPLFAVKPG